MVNIDKNLYKQKLHKLFGVLNGFQLRKGIRRPKRWRAARGPHAFGRGRLAHPGTPNTQHIHLRTHLTNVRQVRAMCPGGHCHRCDNIAVNTRDKIPLPVWVSLLGRVPDEGTDWL